MIFRRYHALMRTICSRALIYREDVEDAVQETFFKAYKGIPQMTCESLGAWLAQIARHVCIDRIRHDQRRPRCIEWNESTLPGAVEGPERMVASGDPRLQETLRRLSADQREVVSLRYLEGLSYLEIATAMQKRPGQVKALIFRAKRRLRLEWVAASAA